MFGRKLSSQELKVKLKYFVCLLRGLGKCKTVGEVKAIKSKK